MAEDGMVFPDFTPTVPVFIRTLAERHGERPLVVLGERRLSYRAAERESARLARGLLASGAGKGTRVGVLMSNGPDWVLAWLAASRIGAVVVPINTFYQAAELGWVLRHADVDTLLCQARLLNHDYLERLEACAPELAEQRGAPLRAPGLPYLRAVRSWGGTNRPGGGTNRPGGGTNRPRGGTNRPGGGTNRPRGGMNRPRGGMNRPRGGTNRAWASDEPAALAALAESGGIDDAHLRAVEDCVTPADPMVIIYSSGSTADPKGAVHSHGGLLRHAFNLNGYRDLRGDDRIYSPMPFFWVGGFTFTLLAGMHAGACLLCEESFEPGRTLDLLERERATVVAGWPHYAKAMAEHPSFPERDLTSIRSGNLYAVLPDAARPGDPELRSNSLGMTETGGPHTIDRMDRDLPEELRGSFGRSVAGLEHKVVDPDTGETLPAGEHGEICVRGYALMQGLYKLEREEAFDREGYYHTGDSGYLDAGGHLFFKGRLGDMIKTAGANVTPREVEVVLESFPEVKEAYVVGVAEPDRGQDVAAAVVLHAGRTGDADALRAAVKSRLSAYKVPRHLQFFASDELPFTDTGKIDRAGLQALLERRIR